MDSKCCPTVWWVKGGRSFQCRGGAHKRLWVRLPKDFEEPRDLTELHDRLVSLFPNGGSHKWVEVTNAEDARHI